MATKLITAHFTVNNIPVTGLTPTILIIRLDPLVNVLEVNGGALTEVGAGWYRYDFSSYDATKSYVFTIDGGNTLAAANRYKYGGNESYVEDISNGVWEEPWSDHTSTGTIGLILTEIKADSGTTVINLSTLQTLVNTLLKYDRNRTKVDTTAHTLTVYDDDCTTPLTVFRLRDHLGNPTITEICERSPTTCP